MLAAKKRRTRSQFSSLSGDERQMLRDKAVAKLQANDAQQQVQKRAVADGGQRTERQHAKSRARMPKFGKAAPAASGGGGLQDAIKRVADQRAKMPTKGAPAKGNGTRALLSRLPTSGGGKGYRTGMHGQPIGDIRKRRPGVFPGGSGKRRLS